MVQITIFTPTYNRAILLTKLYLSLTKQKCKDFEWIIVDDGSVDSTKDVVSQFIETENDFKITYFEQKNQGKHIAINKGVEQATGELFFIVDSDDQLPSDSIQQILEKYNIIKDNPSVAGVVGRKAYFNGQLIGSDLHYEDRICSSLHIRYKYNVQGDMAEVFKTTIFKAYPFPKYLNEKFCPEALIYNRIAVNYELLWFSEPVYLAEYLPDGLTAKIFEIRKKSPMGSSLFYSELSKMPIPLVQKIIATINYWRFAKFSDVSFVEKWRKVNPLLSLIALPLSLIFLLKDIK